MKTQHNIGVATQIGIYSDAVEEPHDARWLMTAGTLGLATDSRSQKIIRPIKNPTGFHEEPK